MKRNLLALFLLGGFAASAQVTIFEDHFDSYEDFAIEGFGNWITLDIDGTDTYTGGMPDGSTPEDYWPNAGEPQAFMVFNPTVAGVTNSTDICSNEGSENRNFDPHSGSKFMASWAGVPDAFADANEDWLISPPITLGASGNQLSFWVKALSSCYNPEEYSVGVYTGTGTPAVSADFTIISDAGTLPATTSWVQKTYALDTYSGQTIRIGIRNESSDAYMLMVDDFLVTATDLSTNENLASKFAVYPNPANDIVNIKNAEGIALESAVLTDVNGRKVMTQNIQAANSEVSLNISDLNSGIYFMTLSSEQGKVTKKITKI